MNQPITSRAELLLRDVMLENGVPVLPMGRPALEHALR